MPFDYKKEYKEFYLPPLVPVIIDVPTMNYIAVRGRGDPNDEGGEYKAAIGLLYGVAFTIKMSRKSGRSMEGYFEYVVPPLEGLWWQDGVTGVDYSNKSTFQWISMIRIPDFVTKADFDWAVDCACQKKKQDFSKVEFLTYTEGLCVQCMHIGAYDDEPATVDCGGIFMNRGSFFRMMCERICAGAGAYNVGWRTTATRYTYVTEPALNGTDGTTNNVNMYKGAVTLTLNGSSVTGYSNAWGYLGMAGANFSRIYTSGQAFTSASYGGIGSNSSTAGVTRVNYSRCLNIITRCVTYMGNNSGTLANYANTSYKALSASRNVKDGVELSGKLQSASPKAGMSSSISATGSITAKLELGSSFAPQMAATVPDLYEAAATQTLANAPAITVTSYELDANNNRTGTSSIVETVTFNEAGTEAYSTAIDNGMTNILVNGEIKASSFTYTASTNVFEWIINKNNAQELTLSLPVYLTGSMEGLLGNGGDYSLGTVKLYNDRTVELASFDMGTVNFEPYQKLPDAPAPTPTPEPGQPAAPEKQFAGYIAQNSDGEYVFLDAGSDYFGKLNTDTDFEPLYIGIDTQIGAAVRMYSPTGLRFTTTIVYSDYAKLSNVTSVESGTLIIPTDYIGSNVTEFTKEALDEWGGTYLDVERTKWASTDYENNGGVYTFAGTIWNIKKQNYNRSFSARGYLTFTFSDNTTKTIYADYDTVSNSRKVCDVAYAAITDPTASYNTGAYNVLKGFVDGVVNIKCIPGTTASTVWGDEKYTCPYTVSMEGNTLTVSAAPGSSWTPEKVAAFTLTRDGMTFRLTASDYTATATEITYTLS